MYINAFFNAQAPHTACFMWQLREDREFIEVFNNEEL